jgi:hypothetical protein
LSLCHNVVFYGNICLFPKTNTYKFLKHTRSKFLTKSPGVYEHSVNIFIQNTYKMIIPFKPKHAGILSLLHSAYYPLKLQSLILWLITKFKV